MQLADRFGFGPKREFEMLPNGNWKVTVTPPSWSGFSASSLELTPDQYRRVGLWNRGALIQDALPDLTAAQREILKTGIGPAEWDAAFKEEEEGDG